MDKNRNSQNTSKMRCFMKKNILKFIFLIIIVCVLLSLLFVEIKPLLTKCSMLNTLNQNFIFLAKQIDKFDSLLIVSLLIFVVIYCKSKFTFEISSFSIGNINVNVKNTDQIVKSNIKNYLNTKRTLFLIDLKYDNFYEVFDSYYKVYCFLRDQIQLCDRNTNSNIYECINNAFEKLNIFLTKHQSNYRRWYENERLKDEFADMDIYDIQKEYRHYDELCSDFEKINISMSKLAEIFNINIEKWK